MLTFDDVLHWDPSKIKGVYQAATNRVQALDNLQENLDRVPLFVGWSGDAGQAFQSNLQKGRKEIDADTHKTQSVAAAAGRAEQEVSQCQADAHWIQAYAEANKWTITPDWKIDVGNSAVGKPAVGNNFWERVVVTAQLQLLRSELDKLKTQANQADHELATAMHAAVAEGFVSPPKPTGPVYAKAIPLSAVSYKGLGAWAAGPEAVRGYINQALDAEGITDPTARANWMNGMMTLVGRESSYNGKGPVFQVNQWDSNWASSTYNAADGYGNNDSRGAAQCIPTTFAENHQPGTSDSIYDPVANIAADMNHLMSTYGVSRDGSNLEANVAEANPNAGPQGQ